MSNPKAAKPAGKRGEKVEAVLRLASRRNGASRAELIDLTGWSAAPWRWLFRNPKKTGYCDRRGLRLKVIEGRDGEVRYRVVKR
jgi:hypothetical protein